MTKKRNTSRFLNIDGFRIQSRDDCIQYLKQNPNLYNDFILHRIKNSVAFEQKHHIFPRHAGGPDVDWNLVDLSSKDHIEAHRLRLIVYNEQGDKSAMAFFTNPEMNSYERIQERIKNSHVSQQRNKNGFYSSTKQRENGIKGGKIQTEAKREKYVQKQCAGVAEALSKTMFWKHKTSVGILKIPANSIVLLDEIRTLFLANFSLTDEEKTKLQNVKKSTFTSALRKVLLRQVGRPSLYGFSLIYDEEKLFSLSLCICISISERSETKT